MSWIGNLLDARFGAPSRAMKATQFEQFDLEPGVVVFLGDSITEGGLWHEWFPNRRVANRGIDGDTTAGVLARLATATQGPPAQVFLLIGTNDLGRGVKPPAITANIDTILTGIGESAPEAHVVLQSVMPRDPRFRDTIVGLNDDYRIVAGRHGAAFLDLWPALADSSGCLRREYTLDNLHLNGAGYRSWVEQLRPLVPDEPAGR